MEIAKCEACGWEGSAELTIWVVQHLEEDMDDTYDAKCPKCFSTAISVETVEMDEETVNDKFENIFKLIGQLDEGDAEDLWINVKLLQDKVRDKYWRMDERRKRRTRKTKQTEEEA